MKKAIVHPEDVETQVFDWGTIKWLSCPAVTGAERFTFGVVIVEPGKGHDKHSHPDAEEVIYVISGVAEQFVEGAEPETAPIKQGDLVYIPPGVTHATWNKGWDPLILIVAYAPPGAEEDLKKIADKVLPPGKNPVISAVQK
ncbi:MAG: cupin domain-containing protein [Thaumarchaeota archaeon]|nr:cupin domain-containing protein [Nitrososphaerota archaeon]